MAEFSIIEAFCHGIGPDHVETQLSVGDDAAVVAVPNGFELAVSVDTMVSGVHFYPDVDAAKLAHKILAVNLSDMAAMGAEPKWATMALTVPELDNNWFSQFSTSLRQIANRFGVQIIGGDTTQGPLNLSMTIMGLLPISQRLCRSGAVIGDDVYVSHYLGDAALGLALLQGETVLCEADRKHTVAALELPEPRVELGRALLGVAHSCLDISDGLVGDLGHLCERSNVSIEVDAALLPLSESYRAYVANGGNLDLALNGGDDYELAFTASPDQQQRMAAISKANDILLTRIGTVVEPRDSRVAVSLDGLNYRPANSFEHFS